MVLGQCAPAEPRNCGKDEAHSDEVSFAWSNAHGFSFETGRISVRAFSEMRSGPLCRLVKGRDRTRDLSRLAFAHPPLESRSGRNHLAGGAGQTSPQAMPRSRCAPGVRGAIPEPSGKVMKVSD